MDSTNLLEFFKMCLPESERNFEPDRAHASLLHVEKNLIHLITIITMLLFLLQIL